MKVGYARVSTDQQNSERQEVILKEMGAELVFVDKASGKNQNRQELRRMMNYVRPGDIVMVESISRFARNTRDLLELVEELTSKSISFISQKEAIDTSTPTGKFILTVFGAQAELEREYIKQRQREGIDLAIAAGKYKGRKPKQLNNWDEVYTRWKCNEITATAACSVLGISRSTFYRKVNRDGG